MTTMSEEVTTPVRESGRGLPWRWRIRAAANQGGVLGAAEPLMCSGWGCAVRRRW
jgi:hypothetical protein